MPFCHIQLGGAHHKGHAAPGFHLFLQLFQLHDEVLRGFAVVAEVDIKHAAVASIVP